MKKISIPFTFLCLVLIIQSCANVETQEAKVANISPMVGTWEYHEFEGLATISESHFNWITSDQIVTKDSLTGEETSVTSIFAAGGTYTFTDSVYTWKNLYSTNPDVPGTSFQTINIIEDNIVKFSGIKPDGSIGDPAHARRISGK